MDVAWGINTVEFVNSGRRDGLNERCKNECMKLVLAVITVAKTYLLIGILWAVNTNDLSGCFVCLVTVLNELLLER